MIFKGVVFLKTAILVGILAVSNVSLCYSSDARGEAEEREVFRIAPLSEADRQAVIKICLEHAKSAEENLLKLPFTSVMAAHRATNEAKAVGAVDEIFGFYGLHYTGSEAEDERMIGLVSIEMDCRIAVNANGYAECQMLMHPDFRGKGLGSEFRRRFNETIVAPKVGRILKFLLSGKPMEAEFYGAKGFVHVDNLASRKVLTKAGYRPLELPYTPYQATGDPVAQIVYVYPPHAKRPCQLDDDLVGIILENNPAHRRTIVEAAEIRQSLLSSTATLIEGARTVFATSNSFRDVFSFMKRHAAGEGKPFPEEEFNGFVGAQKEQLEEIGRWSGDYDAELGQIIRENLADFPAKMVGIPAHMLEMMRAM